MKSFVNKKQILNLKILVVAICTLLMLFISDAKAFNQRGNRLVFSSNPIDSNNPTNLSTNFNGGDYIYGLLILNKPFNEFVKEDSFRDSTKGFNVTRPKIDIEFLIDDSPMFDGSHSLVFSLEQKEGMWDAVPKDNYFFFDIAPEASNAKTYSYKNLHFPRLSAVGRTGNKAKAGAQFYSHHLSKLSPGNHNITIKVRGKEEVIGQFTINGSNYAF